MHLTLLSKLQPTTDQAQTLLHTMEQVNATCNALAATAFREHTAHKIRWQKLVYADIRTTGGLPAQMTGRAMSKGAAAYKRDNTVPPTCRPHGAIAYDPRMLSWKGWDQVSIRTVDGRQRIPVVRDGYHRARMDRIRGQADLIFRDGPFVLAVVVDVPEPPPWPPDDWRGVDLGIVNLAADSDGTTYSGGQVNGLRKRHAK
jgi:putative transposase